MTSPDPADLPAYLRAAAGLAGQLLGNPALTDPDTRPIAQHRLIRDAANQLTDGKIGVLLDVIATLTMRTYIAERAARTGAEVTQIAAAFDAGCRAAADAIRAADTSGWPGGRQGDVDACRDHAATVAENASRMATRIPTEVKLQFGIITTGPATTDEEHRG